MSKIWLSHDLTNCFNVLFLSSQETYTCDAVLNETAVLNWTFPPLLTKDRHLSLVIQKESCELDSEEFDVILLDQGGLNVFPPYTGRVGLCFDCFTDGVVSLKIDPVYITDAGDYCIIVMQPYVIRRMCHLNVRG